MEVVEVVEVAVGEAVGVVEGATKYTHRLPVRIQPLAHSSHAAPLKPVKQSHCPLPVRQRPLPPHCCVDPAGIGHALTTVGQSSGQQASAPPEHISPTSHWSLPQVPARSTTGSARIVFPRSDVDSRANMSVPCRAEDALPADGSTLITTATEEANWRAVCSRRLPLLASSTEVMPLALMSRAVPMLPAKAC